MARSFFPRTPDHTATEKQDTCRFSLLPFDRGRRIITAYGLFRIRNEKMVLSVSLQSIVLRGILLTTAWCACATSGFGQLVIIPTYGSSINNDLTNGAAIKAGIQAAINRAQSAITNPVTVNILFQETGSGLGSSNTTFGTVQYGPKTTAGTYLNALFNNQVLSAKDNAALSTLPNTANNPVNGNANVAITFPLARALGFSANTASDSTISLNTSLMYFDRSSPVAGKYDLQAVAAHEIDEVLNVGGLASQLPSLTGAVGTLDLYRYGAPGSRSFTTSQSAAAYFSLDAGTTNLVDFNQSGTGDYADWIHHTPPQVQDFSGSTGVNVDIGPNELTALDVVGWNLSSPVPEPGTMALTAGVLAAAAARRLVRRRRAA
jgi:hypothetical protein